MNSDETNTGNRRIIGMRYGSFMSKDLLNSIMSGVWTAKTTQEFNYLLKQVNDGRIIFRRTAQESYPYSASCSEAHAGASILLRGNDGTSTAKQGDPQTEYAREAAEGREQERLIEAWARANNLWLNELTDREGKMARTLEDLIDSQWPFFDQGSEAEVYIYDRQTLIKSINLSHVNDNPGLLLDSLAIFNRLFPQAALEVVGFGRDSLGHFRIIALQRFIQGEELADDELDKAIDSLPGGLTDKGTWYETEDGLAQLTDLAEYNILKDRDGNHFVIDCDIVYNTPERGGNVVFVDELQYC